MHERPCKRCMVVRLPIKGSICVVGSQPREERRQKDEDSEYDELHGLHEGSIVRISPIPPSQPSGDVGKTVSHVG